MSRPGGLRPLLPVTGAVLQGATSTMQDLAALAAPHDAVTDAAARRNRLRAQIPRIRRLVARLMGHHEENDDVVQEVLVQCLRGIGTVRDPDALDDWVASVTTFVVRGTIRGRTRLRRRIEFVPDAPEPAAAPSQGPDALLARRSVARVQGILETLPDELRQAFVLRVLEEVPLERVAAWLGVSLATAKRRVAAAEARFWEAAARDPYLATWTGRSHE